MTTEEKEMVKVERNKFPGSPLSDEALLRCLQHDEESRKKSALLYMAKYIQKVRL